MSVRGAPICVPGAALRVRTPESASRECHVAHANFIDDADPRMSSSNRRLASEFFSVTIKNMRHFIEAALAISARIRQIVDTKRDEIALSDLPSGPLAESVGTSDQVAVLGKAELFVVSSKVAEQRSLNCGAAWKKAPELRDLVSFYDHRAYVCHPDILCDQGAELGEPSRRRLVIRIDEDEIVALRLRRTVISSGGLSAIRCGHDSCRGRWAGSLAASSGVSSVDPSLTTTATTASFQHQRTAATARVIQAG
jgi:hypothetical protein